jgi:DNA adenine methylase
MNISATRPARPFVRYPGSKNQIAAWIVAHFPDAHDTYIEPYGGSAATLFAKERSGIEVYNDLNGDLVHLFRVVRERPEAFVRAIQFTLYAAEELRLACEPADDPLERARRTYVRLWLARHPFDKNLIFRRQKVFSRGANGTSSMRAAAQAFADTAHLHAISERLRGVQIEQMDALELIGRYDYERALFYIDPPYVHAQRARTAHYGVEMERAEHAALADVLNGIAGFAILSGYACELYADLYEAQGWQRVDREARVDGRGQRIESLWLNPRAAAAQPESGRQMALGIGGAV